MRAKPWLVLGIAMACGLAAAPAATGTPKTTRTGEVSVSSLTATLVRYNVEEKQLFPNSAGSQDPIALPAADLMAHWKQLGEVRTALEQLERKGTLRSLGGDRRIVLRHELAVLLGAAVAVNEVTGDYVEERIEAADKARKENLVAIALLVNRSLDFTVQTVLGIPVDSNSQLEPATGDSPG